jgi:hypothetical protein
MEQSRKHEILFPKMKQYMADGYFKSISVKDIIGFSQWKIQWIHVKA